MKRTPLTRKTKLQAKAPKPAREPNPLKSAVLAATPKPATKRKSKGANPIPPAIRAAVVERDRGLCQGCLQRGAQRPGTEAHHVLFRSSGGKHVIENLVLLCYDCHQGPEGPHSLRRVRLAWIQHMAQLYRLTLDAWRQVAAGKVESS